MCSTLKSAAPEHSTPPQPAVPAKDLHLLAYVACPIKQIVCDHVDATAEAYRKAQVPLRLHIPMGCRSDDPYENVAAAASVDDLPAVIVSMGFGDFMTPSFFRRFVAPGFFATAQPAPVPPAFVTAELVDPQGWYTIYSVWAHVLLVDTYRLGTIPVPRSWADLLHPRYAGQIVSDGAHDQRFAPTVLLQYYKDHGEAGLRRLASGIREAVHPAQIVKSAGSSDSRAAAISIVPWSFARVREWPAHLRVVWPEEGAIASPLYALVKANAGEPEKTIARTLVGAELGQQCARAGFPSLNADVDNLLPPAARFRWLGWDYIRKHDAKALTALTAEIAEQAWLGRAA